MMTRILIGDKNMFQQKTNKLKTPNKKNRTKKNMKNTTHIIYFSRAMDGPG